MHQTHFFLAQIYRLILYVRIEGLGGEER